MCVLAFVQDTLLKLEREDHEAFMLNCSLQLFRHRFAGESHANGEAFESSSELEAGCWEWQRRLLIPRKEAVPLLCCPEDVETCRRCRHQPHELCGFCRIPLCHHCHTTMLRMRSSAKRVVPMGLCNDNFWGYTTEVISMYQVRWLEAAIVSPCWTSMVVYYVEGDKGHLLNEELGQQRSRTLVRGAACSFHMPWEDILQDLAKNCGKKLDMLQIPRSQECLKYMLRVHVRVAHTDLRKFLKQCYVRPHVLLHLLFFLIDRNHEVFRNKGCAVELKKKMKEAIQQEYPDEESEKPEAQREGSIPTALLEALQEAHQKPDDPGTAEAEAKKMRFLFEREKNATPGDGSRSVDECLQDIRPQAVCMDKEATSNSDPATLREKAIGRYGDLYVQTGSKLIPQWHSKYFAQVQPFVIPRMVSGPDYDMLNRWRRQYEDAPCVSPQAFVAGFARRVESNGRTDWSALPIMRSVAYKHSVEHTMSAHTAFQGKRDRPVHADAKDDVLALQELYWHLHNGFVGKGVHRVPIAGDTTRLPYAEGLTPKQRRLAHAHNFLAQHMPGTQSVRRLMGHTQFGARIVYGDCLFFTISPNEQHSALVLRLSRFRHNDPYVVHGSEFVKACAGREHPLLEVTHTTPHT